MDNIVIFVVLTLLISLLFLEWRKLVFSVLILVVLEGIPRKWIFPQAANLIYFVKDFILVVAYYKYFVFAGKKIIPNYVNFFILLLAIWAVVQVFNPSLGSPIVGLFGLRGYLLYAPLMWMLPNLFSSDINNLYKFIRNYSLLIIPVCLLAIAQFYSPPTSPLNIYAGASENSSVATFGVGSEAIARVTGTFPYISGFATYLSFSFTLLIPLITLRQSVIWRNLTIIELLLVIVSSFMTGTRAVVFYEVFFTIGYLLILSTKKASIAIPIIQKFIFPAILGATIIPVYFSKSINVFNQRVDKNSEEGISRFYSPIVEPINALRKVINLKSIDSYGTGYAHQATPTIRKLLGLRQVDSMYTDIGEGEGGRVAIEIGAVGLIAWICVRISLIFSLWQTTKKVNYPFLQQLAISAFLFHAIGIGTPVVFSPTMSVYYWFLSGFIFLLPEIEYLQNQDNYLYQSSQEIELQNHV